MEFHVKMLPEMTFPTINGKLVEREPVEDKEIGMEGELEYKDVCSTPTETSGTNTLAGTPVTDDSKDDSDSPLKPSSDCVSNDFVSQSILNPKPNVRGFSQQTTTDHWYYLKYKRIIRYRKEKGWKLEKLTSDNDCVSKDLASQSVVNPKSNISECPRQTNRDHSSFLKAKHTIRQKRADRPELKKLNSNCGCFINNHVSHPKPDISKLPLQTNRHTRSYLKAKRIINRNKQEDRPKLKTLKSDSDCVTYDHPVSQSVINPKRNISEFLSYLKAKIISQREADEPKLEKLSDSDCVSNDFVSQPMWNPKPDISEFPRQTYKRMISYL